MMATQQQRAARARRGWDLAKFLVLERDLGVCVRCEAMAVDVHHRRNRGAGGANSDPTSSALSRLIALCRGCHDWIGRNVAVSAAAGWLVPHGAAELCDVPLHYRGGWVRLTDDGQILPVPSGAAL